MSTANPEHKPVYTVGHETTYDAGLRVYPGRFAKQGRRKNYPGGFAVCSLQDAQRLIQEQGDGRGWAIYELQADWERDTRPSESGWWHALIHDRVILRKVVAA